MTQSKRESLEENWGTLALESSPCRTNSSVPRETLLTLSETREVDGVVMPTFTSDTFLVSHFDLVNVVPTGRREVFGGSCVGFSLKHIRKARGDSLVTPKAQDGDTLLTALSFTLRCAISFQLA